MSVNILLVICIDHRVTYIYQSTIIRFNEHLNRSYKLYLWINLYRVEVTIF